MEKIYKKNHVKINKIRFKSFIKRNNCDFTLSTMTQIYFIKTKNTQEQSNWKEQVLL